MLVYHTAWQLHRCSLFTYVLAFPRSSEKFWRFNSYFPGSYLLSLKFLSISLDFSSFRAHLLPFELPFFWNDLLSTEMVWKPPPVFDDIEEDVQAYPLNLAHYLHWEIYASVKQIADPGNLRRHIDEAHCCVRAESFHNYSYDHARGIMTVHFSTTFNHKGATYAAVVQNVDGEKFLKVGYCMVELDDRRWRYSFEMC